MNSIFLVLSSISALLLVSLAYVFALSEQAQRSAFTRYGAPAESFVSAGSSVIQATRFARDSGVDLATTESSLSLYTITVPSILRLDETVKGWFRATFSVLPEAENEQIVTPFGRKILFFLHLHKSGGTSMCLLAKANGYRTRPYYNCNVYFEREKLNVGLFNNTKSCCGNTIQQQIEFAQTNRYEFIANEVGLADELDFTNYDYIVTLREPMSRYISHYEQTVALHRNRWFRKNKLGRWVDPGALDWIRGQQDNYLLRKICGPKCEKLPRGKLTEEHLEQAKTRLGQFGAIIILDKFQESLKILRSKFNWKIIDDKKRNEHKKSGRRVNATEKAQIAEELDFMITFDKELYAYGQYLNQQQVALAGGTRKYYRTGFQNCSTGCCGKKCSVGRFTRR